MKLVKNCVLSKYAQLTEKWDSNPRKWVFGHAHAHQSSVVPHIGPSPALKGCFQASDSSIERLRVAVDDCNSSSCHVASKPASTCTMRTMQGCPHPKRPWIRSKKCIWIYHDISACFLNSKSHDLNWYCGQTDVHVWRRGQAEKC